MVKNPPTTQETGFDPWVGKVPWKRHRLHTPVFFPGEFHGQRSLVGLQSMGSQRLGQDWERLTLTHTHAHTRTHARTHAQVELETRDGNNVVTFIILTTRGQQEAMLLEPLIASVAIPSIYSHIYGKLGGIRFNLLFQQPHFSDGSKWNPTGVRL